MPPMAGLHHATRKRPLPAAADCRTFSRWPTRPSSIRRYRYADGVRATGSAVQIAIVDAFRDNPYEQAPARSIGRGSGRRRTHRRIAGGGAGDGIAVKA
jgi:hypothetical protein